MRLYQLQMAQLIPDNSLLRFQLMKEKFSFVKQNILHPGYVMPANIMFTSEKALLQYSKKIPEQKTDGAVEVIW